MTTKQKRHPKRRKHDYADLDRLIRKRLDKGDTNQQIADYCHISLRQLGLRLKARGWVWVDRGG